MEARASLRGLAVSQYGSIAKFAKHLGWSYSKTHRIVSGEQEINTNDIRDIAVALGLTRAEDIVSVFSLSDRLQTERR